MKARRRDEGGEAAEQSIGDNRTSDKPSASGLLNLMASFPWSPWESRFIASGGRAMYLKGNPGAGGIWKDRPYP